MPEQRLLAVLDTQAILGHGFLQFVTKLHIAGAVILRWSAAIRSEVDAKLEEKWSAERGDATRVLLSQVPDGDLEVGEADFDLATGHCDDGDKHVLAAALAASRAVASDPEVWQDTHVVLVTDNIRDFEIDYASANGVIILERDEFGELLLSARPAAVLTVVDRHPPKRFDGLLERMRNDNMNRTADFIQSVIDQIEAEE